MKFPSHVLLQMSDQDNDRIAQDSHKPSTAAGDVYLELTVIDNVLIVSFKEL